MAKKKARLRLFAALATVKDLLLGIGVCSVLMLAAGHQAAAQYKPKQFPSAVEKRPEVGKTVSMARATWDTGWFQTEIFKKLLEELVQIPLKDLSRQNAKMLDGEDDDEDIRRHALEWIAGNREKIDLWLKAARALQPIKEPTALSQLELGQSCRFAFPGTKLRYCAPGQKSLPGKN